MDELIFAVPAAELWNILTCKEKGFIPGNTDVLKMIVQKGIFRKRNELEEDPYLKQLISYGVISNENTYFLIKRASGQREKRLLNLYSLGVGGHMNPGGSMVPGDQYLTSELKRELFEEVRFENGCTVEEIQFAGFLNDDTIQVGRFHIGLLYNVRVSGKDLFVNEKDKLTAEWVEKSKLAEFYEGMETWSQFVFDQFIK